MWLSVSPIGSSPLQPAQGWGCAASGGTFSIPNRIEPSATVCVYGGCESSDHFQYPQSDRALCNHELITQAEKALAAFSIPNRIEPSATGPGRHQCHTEIDLSVSPIGSSPLQPFPILVHRAVPVAFSIPNRIEPSATLGGGYVCRNGSNFQYPQSDRALCNYAYPRIPDPPPPDFQYPQSDRALCNQLLNKLPGTRHCSLSVSPIGSSPLQLRQ